MLKFFSFGSGSSGNCYLLYSPDDAILIDAGVGVRTLKKQFAMYGLSMSAIHYILITHDHADHVKSVGSLSRDLHVPVYATKKVHQGINNNYCVRQKIDGADAKAIEKNQTLQLGDFQVTPFDVPHDSNDNVGFFITYHDVNFCLMTDAGHVTDEMKALISQANYLVIEANHDVEMLLGGNYPAYLKQRISGPTGHLSNKDCAQALVENATPDLRQVWLCHLSEENNHPELARITVEHTLRQHGIIAGADFKLDVLKRKNPTGPFDLL